MKFKSMLNLAGLRGKAIHYGYRTEELNLPDGQKLYCAQWQHPKCAKTTVKPEHIAMYKKIISEGDFCIDIGAHSGDSTLPVALAAGATGCVLALEPNPFVYHVLEKNARANRHLCNIDSIMAAAFSKEGFTEFEYSDPGFCNGGRHEGISGLKHGHAYKLSVYGINLQNELYDNYAAWLPKLKFIKTDAEGYDLYVLRTLSAIIKQYRPFVKTEVFKHTDLGYRRSLLQFFRELGYAVHKINEEPIGYGAALTDEALLSERHYDIVAVPLT